MKTGNVLATGVRKNAVKKTARKGGAEKALPSAPDAAGIAAQKFLSVGLVAKRWGVSGNTIRRLIEEGELNGMKVRHASMLSLASVEAYEKRAEF